MEQRKTSSSANRVLLRDFARNIIPKFGNAKAVFNAFDINGNGVISASEFAHHANGLVPGIDTKAIFKALDDNGCGDITLNEFLILDELFAEQELAGEIKEHVDWQLRDFAALTIAKYGSASAAFKAFDVNGSGMISAGEFARMCKYLFNGDADAIFKALSSDKRGALSAEEFLVLDGIFKNTQGEGGKRQQARGGTLDKDDGAAKSMGARMPAKDRLLVEAAMEGATADKGTVLGDAPPEGAMSNDSECAIAQVFAREKPAKVGVKWGASFRSMPGGRLKPFDCLTYQKLYAQHAQKLDKQAKQRLESEAKDNERELALMKRTIKVGTEETLEAVCSKLYDDAAVRRQRRSDLQKTKDRTEEAGISASPPPPEPSNETVYERLHAQALLVRQSHEEMAQSKVENEIHYLLENSVHRRGEGRDPSEACIRLYEDVQARKERKMRLARTYQLTCSFQPDCNVRRTFRPSCRFTPSTMERASELPVRSTGTFFGKELTVASTDTGFRKKKKALVADNVARLYGDAQVLRAKLEARREWEHDQLIERTRRGVKYSGESACLRLYDESVRRREEHRANLGLLNRQPSGSTLEMQHDVNRCLERIYGLSQTQLVSGDEEQTEEDLQVAETTSVLTMLSEGDPQLRATSGCPPHATPLAHSKCSGNPLHYRSSPDSLSETPLSHSKSCPTSMASSVELDAALAMEGLHTTGGFEFFRRVMPGMAAWEANGAVGWHQDVDVESQGSETCESEDDLRSEFTPPAQGLVPGAWDTMLRTTMHSPSLPRGRQPPAPSGAQSDTGLSTSLGLGTLSQSTPSHSSQEFSSRGGTPARLSQESLSQRASVAPQASHGRGPQGLRPVDISVTTGSSIRSIQSEFDAAIEKSEDFRIDARESDDLMATRPLDHWMNALARNSEGNEAIATDGLPVGPRAPCEASQNTPARRRTDRTRSELVASFSRPGAADQGGTPPGDSCSWAARSPTPRHPQVTTKKQVLRRAQTLGAGQEGGDNVHHPAPGSPSSSSYRAVKSAGHGKRRGPDETNALLREFALAIVLQYGSASEAFRAIDINGSGSLTRSKFVYGTERVYDGDLIAIFKALDDDRRGAISAKKFGILEDLFMEQLEASPELAAEAGRRGCVAMHKQTGGGTSSPTPSPISPGFERAVPGQPSISLSKCPMELAQYAQAALPKAGARAGMASSPKSPKSVGRAGGPGIASALTPNSLEKQPRPAVKLKVEPPQITKQVKVTPSPEMDRQEARVLQTAIGAEVVPPAAYVNGAACQTLSARNHTKGARGGAGRGRVGGKGARDSPPCSPAYQRSPPMNHSSDIALASPWYCLEELGWSKY